MSKKSSKVKFSTSSPAVAIIFFIMGLLLIVGSIKWDTDTTTASSFAKVMDSLLCVFGQTFVGSYAISLSGLIRSAPSAED